MEKEKLTKTDDEKSVNEPPSNHEELIESILEKLGSPGKYHIITYLFILCCNAFVVLHHVTIPSTIGITPNDFRCMESFDYHNKLGLSSNTSLNELEFSRCHVSSIQNKSIKTPCQQWKYEYGEEGVFNSIVTKWNLVCDRSFYSQLSNSIYYIGVLIGSLTLSKFADKYGRRTMLLPFFLLSIIVSLAITIANNLILFLVLRFILGVSISVVHTTTNVLLTEVSRKKHVTFLSLVVMCFFLVCVTAGGAISWLLKDWKWTQIAIASPMILPVLGSFFYVPESFRWLLLHGRHEDFKKHVTRASRVNKVDITEKLDHLNTMKSNESLSEKVLEEVKSVWQVLKYKELRKRLFIMIYTWFVIILAYMTMSLNVKQLSKSPYKSFIYAAAADCVPMVFAILTIFKFGKRRILCTYFFLGGILCITYKFYHHIAIMMSGKMFCGMSSALLVFYTVDIFPLVVRNTCMGLCVTFSRVGSFLAPQLVLLGTHSSPDIPILIVGALLLTASVMMYFLPDDLHKPMPNTIADVENYGLKKKDDIVKV